MSSPRFWQKLGIGKQHSSSNNKSGSTHSDSSKKKNNSDTHSSISYYQLNDALDHTNGKQVKRFSSNMSLRHRASSASLYQQSTLPEMQIRRASVIAPLKRVDPETSSIKLSESMVSEVQHSIRKMPSSISRMMSCDPQQQQQQTKIPTSAKPTRKPSCMDISSNGRNLPLFPPPPPPPPQASAPRLKKTRSNQSLMSTSTATSAGSRPSVESQQKSNSNNSRLRQLSPAISHTKLLTRSDSNSSLHSSHARRKKSLPKISSNTSSSGTEDEPYLIRSLSNESTSDRCEDSYSGDRKRSGNHGNNSSKQTIVNDQGNIGDDYMMDTLKQELNREKAATKVLQGQKDAIAKDLDYFCNLVDEVTEERDCYKRQYEQEKQQNQLLNDRVKDLESRDASGAPTTDSQLQIELQNLQQQSTEEKYHYYNALQCKDDEINMLKTELKQAQRQIQVLRKTMEQLLKADGKDFDENYDFDQPLPRRKSLVAMEQKNEKHLLLQASYRPDQPESHSSSRTTTSGVSLTSPPSPTPCCAMPMNSSVIDHEDDLLSVSSKDSYNSSKGHQLKLQYEFLKYDESDNHHQKSTLAKRKSEDFSKKIALCRRRKDQLEEMLGEVDIQLNRVKQKIRPSS